MDINLIIKDVLIDLSLAFLLTCSLIILYLLLLLALSIKRKASLLIYLILSVQVLTRRLLNLSKEVNLRLEWIFFRIVIYILCLFWAHIMICWLCLVFHHDLKVLTLYPWRSSNCINTSNAMLTLIPRQRISYLKLQQ